jgi:hypothetical protein
MSVRPSYWDIVLAYIREGDAARREGRPASAVEVEKMLGLDLAEGMGFVKYLKDRHFIATDLPQNAIGAYRLLPDGLALADGVPTLEAKLLVQTRQIEVLRKQAAPDRTAQVTASFREVTIKLAVERGVGWVANNWRLIWQLLRGQYPDIPPELPL